MKKPTFPRRLYTRGAEPEAQKSISYGSNDKKLFAAVKKLLSDAEWETLCDSRVGVFCKFHDLDFAWSSKLVHTMLSYQLECKKKYEIWVAVADSPIRFSLHEFEHLTGLNCDYVEDIDDPKCKVTLEMRAFWEKLGVDVELGPSQVEIIRACEWATYWPSEDKLRLGYLGIYTGFIAARKNTSYTPVNLESSRCSGEESYTPESAKRKRASAPGDEMQKRQCPESVSSAEDGFSRFEEKMKEGDPHRKNSPVYASSIKASKHQPVEPDADNEKNEPSVEDGRAEEKAAKDAAVSEKDAKDATPRKDATVSEKDATPKKDESSGEEEEEEADIGEKIGDNSTEKAATPKQRKAPARVSNKPSPTMKKNQPAEPTRILRNRKQNPKYKQ
ncbi:unnamed protein product [Microthlaspi erraticum]|uniref:DUF1985 domain-containing protein n=1 Tax=Microthlaspi erraticum TaxID=1685480 RepID=A0A6D2HRY1_9BRAS|nr:unnamed protein product [Microthlaspi erraticum]